MCQFGTSDNIIKEYTLEEANSIIGYRNNIIFNSFNNGEKMLKSTNIDYSWPKKLLAEGKPLRENSEGIYSYYNNNYYNYNYNNYNYNNNYNNYYNILLLIKIHGLIFEYKEGYRSQFAKPHQLVILDKDSSWFTDEETIKFANHFNSTLENLAKEYDCETIEWSKIK